MIVDMILSAFRGFILIRTGADFFSKKLGFGGQNHGFRDFFAIFLRFIYIFECEFDFFCIFCVVIQQFFSGCKHPSGHRLG